MTEDEWVSSVRPRALMGYLIDERQRGRYPERLFRLFACAAVRRLDAGLLDRRCLRAIDVAERFADGRATTRELGRALRDAHAAAAGLDDERALAAALCVVALAGESAVPGAWEIVQRSHQFDGSEGQSELLREVFGNPFHSPTLPDGWRAWNGGTILRLARHARDEGRFDELPVLGDALEEAGCTDATILEHCRTGTHVAGCWVVELLLADE